MHISKRGDKGLDVLYAVRNACLHGIIDNVHEVGIFHLLGSGLIGFAGVLTREEVELMVDKFNQFGIVRDAVAEAQEVVALSQFFSHWCITLPFRGDAPLTLIIILILGRIATGSFGKHKKKFCQVFFL